MVGIEPTTYGLRNRCSTTELHWRETLGGRVLRAFDDNLSIIFCHPKIDRNQIPARGQPLFPRIGFPIPF